MRSTGRQPLPRKRCARTSSLGMEENSRRKMYEELQGDDQLVELKVNNCDMAAGREILLPR